ncbi:MAG TPA: hypothetical protein VGO14_11755 [Solirubrobacteraceae bacterium]|jgi:hypothetical protein|nr:hypothetical protein [Solirubrobacteraceae bacterium]
MDSYLAFLVGAGSAVDISGRLAYDLEGAARPGNGADPAAAVASDMARVMRGFGRAARCARYAVDAGRSIDDLPPGCTLNGGNGDERQRASAYTLRESTLALFRR